MFRDTTSTATRGYARPSFMSLAWGRLDGAAYEAGCACFEVRVRFRARCDVEAVLGAGGLRYDKRKAGARGRARRCNVDRLGLRAG
eukprot:14674419-Alexandrium_andersonii.AAC.1